MTWRFHFPLRNYDFNTMKNMSKNQPLERANINNDNDHYDDEMQNISSNIYILFMADITQHFNFIQPV